VFVSNDRLHQRCAPLFMRENQEFVWGPDLKADLARINAHFLNAPDAEKELGIMRFAHAPPKNDGSLVRRLRARFLGTDYDDRPPPGPPRNDEKSKKLVEKLTRWQHAPAAEQTDAPRSVSLDDMESVSMARLVPKRKGSWWLVPKDLKGGKSD
jgi:hypothetical protein